MNVGSLFSGIGGFDLGFERAGMRTSWFVEQDPYCQAVLAKHWPGVPVHDDVCAVSGANLEPVDLLCGGFPCQDLSVAGRGAGLAGARSGLWTEFHRLIGELRPRYVVVENVPVLRSRGLGRILGEMAEIGYDAEWDVVSAQTIGAPHLRERIWVVAYPQREQLRQQPGRRCRTDGTGSALVAVDGEARAVADATGSGRLEEHPHGNRSSEGTRSGTRNRSARSSETLADAASGRWERRPDRSEGDSSVGQATEWRKGVHQPPGSSDVLADADRISQLESHDASRAVSRKLARQSSGRRSERGGSRVWPSSWTVEPDVGRVADGVPARMDRLRALGNALVPQIAEEIGRRIIAYEEVLSQ